MPYVLIIVGTLMTVTGIQNTYAPFGAQLRQDGQAFIKWAAAIGIVGAAGYVPDLKPFSTAFLILILIAILLANSKSGVGFFGNLQNAINAASTGTASATPAPASGGINVTNMLNQAFALVGNASGNAGTGK